MQLCEDTLEILKNFASVNTGVFIRKGNELSTTEKTSKTIAIYATIKETFPLDFGIYDLGKLLSICSLTKQFPELDFDEHHVLISNLGGRSKIKYRYCSEEMLTVPGKNKLELPSEEIEFLLEETDYVWVSNTAKILETPTVSIKSDGVKLYLITYDSKNDSIPDQSLEIGNAKTDVKFNMVIDFNLWNKLIPDSYEVTISSQGIARFKHPSRALEYFIALDDSSEYDI